MLQERNEQLISTIYKCVDACNYCAAACLEEQDVSMMTVCIKLDMDCADICQVTAGLLSRGSEHGQHLLKECEEICNLCADECEKHGEKGMQHCKECAEACRECAEACSQVEHA